MQSFVTSLFGSSGLNKTGENIELHSLHSPSELNLPTSTSSALPPHKKLRTKPKKKKNKKKKGDTLENEEEISFGIQVEDVDTIIKLDNVHKTYLLGVEGVPALRGVSLSILPGEFVIIFGTSGGGKTSLLNIIGTTDQHTRGHLFLCGQRINTRTPDRILSELRLKHIGFVFQTFNLLPGLTAVENVEVPMILSASLTPKQRSERANHLLNQVGMKDRKDHYPSQLSGGEQQRVTIARAMANRPKLLLLDEPTGDLDSTNTAIVMKLLLDLNRNEGITLVMVTHDVGLKNFADRVVLLRDGKIQSLTNIPKQVRDQNLHSLTTHLKELQKNKQLSSTVGLILQDSAREEENEISAPDQTLKKKRTEILFDNTQIRKPEFYSHFHEPHYSQSMTRSVTDGEFWTPAATGTTTTTTTSKTGELQEIIVND